MRHFLLSQADRTRAGPDDYGNHVVAGVVSDSFLDFSKSRGNDLTGILRPGCAWCLCASRWKEALLAHRDDPNAFPADVVPKVMLDATHERALESVPLDELKKWSVTGPGRANGEL